MGIAPHYILDLGLVIIATGVLGARLLYVTMNLKYYLKNPLEIILLNKGGLVFQGGFILSLLIGIIVVKTWKLSVLKMADLVILFLPLGQAIGRIGCFLNGCCFGKQTDSVFGIKVIEHSFAAEVFGPDKYIHPVQIYSSIIDVCIYFILLVRAKNKQYDGQVTVCYMLLYGVARFLLEYIRADNPAVFYGFNIPQILSVLMIVISIVLSLIIRNVKRKQV